jgi:hypothetical protein
VADERDDDALHMLLRLDAGRAFREDLADDFGPARQAEDVEGGSIDAVTSVELFGLSTRTRVMALEPRS